jgi:hypothetical protein
MGNFNIKLENKLIASGTHFWCSGHLGAIPVGEQSADPRYCRACFDLLSAEVKILKETHQFHKSASWLPKVPSNNPPETPGQGLEGPNTGLDIFGTDEDNKTHRGILVHSRGRQKIEIPVDQVIGLRKQGKGIRDIAIQLGLSPMTVSRTLAGMKR